MDKLDLDMDDILTLEDIPLLKDIVSEGCNSSPADSAPSTNFQQPQYTQATETVSESKANPFLPYEHLAKLALEREKFTQSIEAFTENLKHENKDRKQNYTTRDMLTSNKNDAIVQSITNKVLNQLKPIIEERVASELNLYFEDIKDDY